MSELTAKQQAFVDYYIEGNGNATQAAIRAGYSESGARVQGHKNLTKANIREAIKLRMDEIHDERTVNVREAVERLSSKARGEPQKSDSKVINNITGDIIRDMTYHTSPRDEDQIRSLELILRYHGAHEFGYEDMAKEKTRKLKAEADIKEKESTQEAADQEKQVASMLDRVNKLILDDDDAD